VLSQPSPLHGLGLTHLEETQTDTRRTCNLHKERHLGSAGTRTGDLLAGTVHGTFPQRKTFLSINAVNYKGTPVET